MKKQSNEEKDMKRNDKREAEMETIKAILFYEEARAILDEHGIRSSHELKVELDRIESLEKFVVLIFWIRLLVLRDWPGALRIAAKLHEISRRHGKSHEAPQLRVPGKVSDRG